MRSWRMRGLCRGIALLKIKMFYKGDIHNRKGDYGEQLIIDLLESKGCRLIEKHNDEPHKIDFLFSGTHFPPNRFYVEVKTKSHREYYQDVGINKNSHYFYSELQKIFPVWLFFVDSTAGEIYGQDLKVLDNAGEFYPIEDKGVIYYPLNRMIRLRKLSKKEIGTLKELSFA